MHANSDNLRKYSILGIIFCFFILFFSDWWLYIIILSLGVLLAPYLEIWEEMLAVVFVFILGAISFYLFRYIHVNLAFIIILGIYFLGKEFVTEIRPYIKKLQPSVSSWLGHKHKRSDDTPEEMATGNYIFSPTMLLLILFIIGIFSLNSTIASFYTEHQEKICGVVVKDKNSYSRIVKNDTQEYWLSRYRRSVNIGDKVCVTYLPHEKSPLPRDYTYRLEDDKTE